MPADYYKMYSKSEMLAMGIDTESGFDAMFKDGIDRNGDGDYYDDGEWFPWGVGALEYWGVHEGDGPDMPDELPFPAGGPQAPDLPVYHGYTVLDTAHRVSEAVVPSTNSIAMFAPEEGGDHVWDPMRARYVPVLPGDGTHVKGFHHDRADLAILVDVDGEWDAFDSGGNSVRYLLERAVRTTKMYDARQTRESPADTPIVAIDIEELNQSGAFPENGLLYAAHYGMGEGANARGVMLANGARLKAPLTVVSEGPVYVRGDYNTELKKPPR